MNESDMYEKACGNGRAMIPTFGGRCELQGGCTGLPQTACLRMARH